MDQDSLTKCAAYHYHQEAGAWVIKEQGSILVSSIFPELLKNSISFLQFNILFKPANAETRMKALGDLIQKLQPDLICLQEVTKEHSSYLLQQEWAKGFIVSDPYLSQFKMHHGVVILSKIDFADLFYYSFKGKKDRKALFALIPLKGSQTPLCVNTWHLASGRESTFHRESQIKFISQISEPFPQSLCLGDANSFSSKENLFWPKKYKDMWEILNSGDPGYTIGSCRLDRVFYSIDTLEGLFLRIVGGDSITCEKTGQELTISDHKGLFGKVKLKKVTSTVTSPVVIT